MLRGVVTGVGALACLVALGAVTASTLPAGAPPRTEAGRFVPVDGQGRQVAVADISGEPGRAFATLEQTVDADPDEVVATIAAPELLGAADPDFSAPCPDADCASLWWREHLYSAGWQSQSDRVYTLTSRGIELRWLDVGIGQHVALAPGAVLLPEAAAPGQSWQGEGTGQSAGRTPLHWAIAGRMDASPRQDNLSDDPECRTTVIELTVTGGPWGDDGAEVSWADRMTWCPGRGVVERGPADGQGGTVGGFAPSPLVLISTSNAWEESQWPAPDRLGILTPRPLGFIDGRGAPTEAHPAAELPWPTDAGGLVTLEPSRANLVSFVMGSGRLGADQQRTALHPGGRIEKVGWAGDLLLVTTSQRRLVAYSNGFVRNWAVDLPDLAVAAPVTLGSSAVVVTADSAVTGYNIVTGDRSWQLRVPGARLVGGDGSTAAVVDGSGRVSLIGPGGHVVTRLQGHPDPVGIAVSNGRVVTWGMDWIGSPSQPGHTGQSTWLREGRSIGQVEVYVKSYGWGRVAVRTGGRLEVLDVSDGGPAWSAEHIRGMGAVHGGLALVDDSSVWTVDENGNEVARMLLPFWQPGPDDEVTVRADRTMMWVLARNPAGQVYGQMLGRESQ